MSAVASSLMLTEPGTLSTYLSIPFLMTPYTPVTAGTVSVCIFHILAISISKSVYLESFSAVFTGVFLSDGTAMSTI